MRGLKVRFGFGLVLLGFFAVGVVQSSADESGIDVLQDQTYVHRASKMSLRIDKKWEKVHQPYRLRRTGTTSILGMEENVGSVRADKEQPKVVVTVYFTPMGSRPFSDIVNASSNSEKLGEDYDILATVYGKDKVERPVLINIGSYKVYKIVINAGPDTDCQGAGVVYLFEVGTGDDRWRIKVRGTYPVVGKEEYMKVVEGVVRDFKPWVE